MTSQFAYSSALLFLVCLVTSVASQDCASEFHLPRISGQHKIPVRLLFESRWQCYLTDPIDGRTLAFVKSLTDKLTGIHNSSRWFQKLAVKSLGEFSESVIKVDYDIISSEKIIVRHQLAVAKDLYAHIFELGGSVELDGKVLSLDQLPALLLENAEGKTIHAYVIEVFENPCEIFIKSETCDNGATCEVKDGLPYCRCIEGYEGIGCQKWKKEQERRALTILIILLVMMAFCISIFIFVTCCKNPLHFRFSRPVHKLEKKAMPCLEDGTHAVTITSEVMTPKHPEPTFATLQSPISQISPEVDVPCKLPTYRSPCIKQNGTAAAKGGCLPTVAPAPCSALLPPILLPLSEVPSARVSTRPVQDYLRINKKFKLYKCDGKYAWQRN